MLQIAVYISRSLVWPVNQFNFGQEKKENMYCMKAPNFKLTGMWYSYREIHDSLPGFLTLNEREW